MKNKGKTVFLMALLVFTAKCLGFFRDIILAYFFGANRVTDAYFLAQTIPELLFSLVVQAIAIGYIPIYTETKKESKEKSILFTDDLRTICLLLSIATIIIVNLFPQLFVTLLARGFEDNASNLTILFIRISVLALPFRITVAIYTNYLNAEKNFIAPAFNGIVLDIVTILFIFLSNRFSVLLLAISIVVAPIVQMILLSFSVLKTSYKPKLRTSFFRDERIKEIIVMLLPVALGVGASQINVLVDRTLASSYVGGISALNYSNKVANTIENVIVASLATVLFPEFSSFVVERRFDKLSDSIANSIQMLVTIIIPASALVMMYSPEITKILFLRGGFDTAAALLTAGTMRFYSIGLIGISINVVLIRALYSLKQIRKTSLISCLGVCVNVVLNFILSRLMGLKGISLATSIANLTQTFLLFACLKKYMIGFNLRDIFENLFKCGISTGSMLFVSNIMFKNILSNSFSEIVSLALASIFAFLIYFIIGILLRQNGVLQVISYLKIAIQKRKQRVMGLGA